jgi:hypothetical protein
MSDRTVVVSLVCDHLCDKVLLRVSMSVGMGIPSACDTCVITRMQNCLVLPPAVFWLACTCVTSGQRLYAVRMTLHRLQAAHLISTEEASNCIPDLRLARTSVASAQRLLTIIHIISTHDPA